MIATAVGFVVLGAALFGVALTTRTLPPLYGSIAASVAALVVLAVAVAGHHRRHGQAERST